MLSWESRHHSLRIIDLGEVWLALFIWGKFPSSFPLVSTDYSLQGLLLVLLLILFSLLIFFFFWLGGRWGGRNEKSGSCDSSPGRSWEADCSERRRPQAELCVNSCPALWALRVCLLGSQFRLLVDWVQLLSSNATNILCCVSFYLFSWLCWVLVAAHGLSSWGTQAWERVGSAVATLGLCFSMACGTLVPLTSDQPTSLHCKADS